MRVIINTIPRWKIVAYIFFSLLYSFQGLLVAFIIQLAGNIDISHHQAILGFGLFGVLIFVAIYVFMYLNNVLVRSIIKGFNLYLSKKAISHFYTGNLSYSPSELNSFLTQDIVMFWQEYLAPLLIWPVFALSIGASVIYLLLQDLKIGLLFTVGGFLMIIPQFVFSKLLQKRGQVFSQARERSLESITDFTKGIQTIASNEASREFASHVLGKIAATEESQYRYYTSHNLVMFWTGPLKGIGLVVPLILGLLWTKESQLSLTTLLAMMTASMNLVSPLQQLLDATSCIQSAKVIKDKVIEILSLPDFQVRQEKVSADLLSLSIRLEHLTKQFSDKVIFKDISLTLSAGQNILLTGNSGCGKSTLFGILSGQDKDFSGEVFFQDSKANTYSPSYQLVSVIHQKPYIFSGRIRDNLTFFQEYTDEALIAVLKSVHLWDELGQNLDYYLDGQNLSGGQTMKLELARSLLRPRPIILADEVTAALDDDNAKEIRQLLYRQGATVIEIAHNYHSDNYDCLYQLENQTLNQISLV